MSALRAPQIPSRRLGLLICCSASANLVTLARMEGRVCPVVLALTRLATGRRAARNAMLGLTQMLPEPSLWPLASNALELRTHQQGAQICSTALATRATRGPRQRVSSAAPATSKSHRARLLVCLALLAHTRQSMRSRIIAACAHLIRSRPPAVMS